MAKIHREFGKHMREVSKKVEIVKRLICNSADRKAYRKALREVERLSPQEQLEVIDDLRAAAERLDVQPETGMPAVKPRGTVNVRGREVVVEVLQ
jgi:arginine deiminase